MKEKKDINTKKSASPQTEFEVYLHKKRLNILLTFDLLRALILIIWSVLMPFQSDE